MDLDAEMLLEYSVVILIGPQQVSKCNRGPSLRLSNCLLNYAV